MDIVTVLLSAFGGAAVALAAAACLFRQWLKQQFAKELENYKAQLAQKSEVLKTELSIYAHEQNVGLTRIDAQRSEAILSLWAILGDWQDVFLDLTAPNQRLAQDPGRAIQRYQEWARKLMALSDKLSIEVRNRAIFFQQASYEPIAKYGMAVSDITNDFYAATFEGVDLATVKDSKALMENVQRERERLRETAKGNVGDLRGALVHEFRILMKAEKASANPTIERDARKSGARPSL
ncbi:MAG: hypothetical protein A2V78_04170 [Betaproteobacteria bacterium RBG_16_64_18]|nr:MAG: hypothetical protein A2V78_04170 [Betaproteobacteria bacterium RBG_16_64_18]